MTRPTRRLAALATAAAVALLGAGTGAADAAAGADGTAQPPAHGTASTVDLARKDCLGTARNAAVSDERVAVDEARFLDRDRTRAVLTDDRVTAA